MAKSKSLSLRTALFLIVFSWGQANLALAVESMSRPHEKKWTHYGIRPLAMGNAFVAVADDFNALFYNPAGLARLKTWDFEILNPTLEISKTTLGFINDAQEMQSSGSSSTRDTLDLFSQHLGEIQHFAVGLTPHVVLPGFGFGIGFETSATMAFHSQVAADVDIGPRLIVPLAFATNFLEDRLSVGAGVKVVARGGVNREFDIESISAFSKKSDKEDDADKPKLQDFSEGGMGFGADFGMLFTPIKPMEPTIGLSIMDIGGTPYSKKINVGDEALTTPAARSAAMNIGMSIKPWQSERSYLLTALDMHAINQPYSFSKKLNIGTEFGFSQLLRIGVGLHQGYLSSGLQFDVGLLNIRLVTYAEELGVDAGQLMDRRYAFQLKLLL